MSDPIADINRLARERWEGQHGDTHLRVHSDVWATMRTTTPPAPSGPLDNWPPSPDRIMSQLMSIPIVVDDAMKPGTWELRANRDGEVREWGVIAGEPA